MRIAVAREIAASENRVAATPETVKKMRGLGADVAVEPNAGTKSGILDAEFAAAGATLSNDAVKDADVVLKVRRPAASELAHYKKGALVIAVRSEEHTSELQSHSDLVCRLLLEKKKKTKKTSVGNT